MRRIMRRIIKLLVFCMVCAYIGASVGTIIGVASQPDYGQQITQLQQRAGVLEHDHHLFCTVVINQNLDPATMHSVGC